MSPPALPSLATSAIGSLPHTQLELALQLALGLDVPAAPQLPQKDPAEFMVPQALDGLPGLRADREGNCAVDLEEWKKGAATLDARLEKALTQGEGLWRFFPAPTSWQALQPFLWEIEQRRLPFAKVQIAGPMTLRWVLRTADGRALSASPERAAIEAQIFRLVLAKALAMARRVRDAGAIPVVFLDEPGLYAFDRRDPQHLVSLQELRVMVLALRREGSIAGVHCCGNTDWASLLTLGFDVVSLDIRLSLSSLIAAGESFDQFIADGGALALGVVPTDLEVGDDLAALVSSAAAQLEVAAPGLLRRCLLTPACGLALRSVQDTERIFASLRDAQRRLRA